MIKSILVWIPLPYINSWRGEGIAQTIENIVGSSNEENIKYTLLVNKKHYYDLMESLSEKANVSIIPFSLRWLFFNLKNIIKKDEIKYCSNNMDFSTSEINTMELITIVLKKLGIRIPTFNLANTLIYAIKLKLFVLLSYIGRFRQYDVIWLPVPILHWSEKINGKKVQSFWDPFLFEYTEFKDNSLYLNKKYHLLFKSVEHVITQSNNNKEYLVNLYKVDSDKISVVYNGSPDYSNFMVSNWKEENCFLATFPTSNIQATNKEEFIKKLHHEHINRSMLFRLEKRVRKDSKIIMISTQSRIYKGFATLFELIEHHSKLNSNLLYIFTSEIPIKLKEKYAHLHENIFEITRLPNKQHAYLFQISNLILHPSFVEGGLGSYPQFEAASLNIPSLSNKGRHTDELIQVFGKELECTICDFTNTKITISMIETLLVSNEARLQNIQATKKAYIPWKEASMNYESVFIKVANK